MSSFESQPDRIFEASPKADHFFIVGVEKDAAIRKDLSWMVEHMAKARGDRHFNSRSDVSPAALSRYLPRITLLDVLYGAGGNVTDARYRLMGTEISALYGEATGRLISDYHGKEVQSRVCRISTHCIETRLPALGLSKALSNGRDYLDVSVLYFPLSGDDLTVDQFLVYSAVERSSLDGFQI